MKVFLIGMSALVLKTEDYMPRKGLRQYRIR